jgi:hypothetical protein
MSNTTDTGGKPIASVGLKRHILQYNETKSIFEFLDSLYTFEYKMTSHYFILRIAKVAFLSAQIAVHLRCECSYLRISNKYRRLTRNKFLV